MSLVKRTGIITIITVVVVAAALLVYKYAYLVYRNYDYHTSYKDVHGLQRSSPIFLNGVRVGEVTDIELNEEMHHVDVVLTIRKEVPIPKGSVALIAANNLIDTRMVYIQTSDNPQVLTHNDKIIGKYDTTVLEMHDQIAPLIDGAKYILNTAEKNFGNFNRKLERGLVFETQRDVRSLEKDMNSYRKQVNSIDNSAGDILRSLDAIKETTARIANRKDSINASINNAVALTNKAASTNIVAEANELRQSLDTLNQKIKATANSETVIKYLDNKTLYEKAVEKTAAADKGTKEAKENPPTISIIGGN